MAVSGQEINVMKKMDEETNVQFLQFVNVLFFSKYTYRNALWSQSTGKNGNKSEIFADIPLAFIFAQIMNTYT